MEKKPLSFFTAIAPAVLGGAILLLQGCGKDAGRSLSEALSNLSQLPDSDSMVAGNGSNAATASSEYSTLPKILKLGLNLQSVSGTAPTLLSLTPSNADTYFWNGLINTINTAGSATNPQKLQFWGQDTSTPGPGGQGACMMAQSVGESLSRMLEGGTTMCYMKGIVAASTGVTVTGSAQADAFKQTANDKVIRIDISGTPPSRSASVRPGGMNVFFKVYGTNTVTADKYQFAMWMCQSGTIDSLESLVVNKATGEMTASQTQQRNDRSDRTVRTGSNSVTAYLTVDGAGNVVFDKTRSRFAESIQSGSWGNFKGKLEVTGNDLIKARRFHSSSWGTNRDYSVSAFGGTSFDEFRFLQGAFKGNSTQIRSGNHDYHGITEFRNTFYAAVASSDLSAEVDAFNLSSDTFLASYSAPTFSSGSFSCSDTADVTIAMNFDDSAVHNVAESCENKSNRINYGMCNSTAVRDAMTLVFAP